MTPDPDLVNLQERIKQAKGDAVTPESLSENENKALGLRAGTELIVAVLAGGLIGYGIDHMFQTKPFGIMIMLILGMITGFYNIWRITNNLSTGIGFHQLQNGKKTAKTPHIDVDRP